MNWKWFFVSLVLAGGGMLGTLFVGGGFEKKTDGQVLADTTEKIVIVGVEQIVPSPTTTPTATPTPTPTPSPTPEVAQYSAREIDEFFEQYASEHDLDVWLLRNIAVCESGYRAQVTNLYYQGMYQFSAPTWRARRAEMGEDTAEHLRNDAREAIKTAAYSLSKGYGKQMWPNCVD